jgi:hypothetical protein
MKQIIRLTESDLHRIVNESVRKILREMDDLGGDMVEDDIDEEGEGGIGNFTYDAPIGGSGEFWKPAMRRDKPVTNMGERV